MSNRSHDPNIWIDQGWFKKLNPIEKLVYIYIKDRCDWAGVWHIDVINLLENIGIESFDIGGFIKRLNVDYDKMTGKEMVRERVILLKDKNLLWITGFVQFQNAGNKPYVKIHSNNLIGAFEKLANYGLLKISLENKFIKFDDHTQVMLSEYLIPGMSDIDLLKHIRHIKAMILKEGSEVIEKVTIQHELKDIPISTQQDQVLVQQMAEEYKATHENFALEPKNHFPVLMNLAYRIARWKKWSKDSVTNGKLEQTLKAWKEIMIFCKGDPKWFATLTIHDLNKDNQWERLLNTMAGSGRIDGGQRAGPSATDLLEAENRKKLGI